MRMSFFLSVLASGSIVNCAALPPHKQPTLERRHGIDPGLGGRVSPLNRPNPHYTPDQLKDLKLAYTQVERTALLQSYGTGDEYFKFDFTSVGDDSNAGRGEGGYGFLAYAPNFPALLGTGVSMAIGYLQPCGLDSMHIHNRATEIVVLVKGQSLQTGFVMEDGDNTPVINTIGLYQGAVRPQGSIHWEYNPHCSPALFIAALSSEDPGVSRIAQNFFVDDPDLVYADLGYPTFLSPENITAFSHTLPLAFALGAQECLTRCGITYNATVNGTSSI